MVKAVEAIQTIVMTVCPLTIIDMIVMELKSKSKLFN